MQQKTLPLIIIVIIFVGVGAWFATRQMGHPQGGFESAPAADTSPETKEPTPQTSATPPQNGGFPTGMRIDRQLSSDAFGLEVTPSAQTIKAGEEMKLAVNVTSKTAPHARTKVSFLVDDNTAEELQGTVPPYQSATAEFSWQAEAGTHTLAVVLASAVGVEFARWEGTLDVSTD